MTLLVKKHNIVKKARFWNKAYKNIQINISQNKTYKKGIPLYIYKVATSGSLFTKTRLGNSLYISVWKQECFGGL